MSVQGTREQDIETVLVPCATVHTRYLRRLRHKLSAPELKPECVVLPALVLKTASLAS